MKEAFQKDSNLANEIIERLRFRIHKIKLKLEDKGKVITLESIRDKLLDKENFKKKSSTFFKNITKNENKKSEFR